MDGLGGVDGGVYVITKTEPGFVGITPIVETVRGTQGTNKRVRYGLICANHRSSRALRSSLFSSLNVHGPSICLNIRYRGVGRLANVIVTRFRHCLRRGPASIIVIISSLTSAVTITVIAGGRNIRLTRVTTNAHDFSVAVPGRVGHLIVSKLSSVLFATNVSGGDVTGGRNTRLSGICVINGMLVSGVQFLRRHVGHPRIVSRRRLRSNGCVILALGHGTVIGGVSRVGALVSAVSDITHRTNVGILTPLHNGTLKFILTFGTCRSITSRRSNVVIIRPRNCLSFSCLSTRTVNMVASSNGITRRTAFGNIPYVALGDCARRRRAMAMKAGRLITRSPRGLRRTVRGVIGNR